MIFWTVPDRRGGGQPSQLEWEVVDTDLSRPAVTRRASADPDSEPEPSCDKDWRSPERALANYLDAIGVPFAGMAAHNLIDEFGTVSELLAASWWKLMPILGMKGASV